MGNGQDRRALVGAALATSIGLVVAGFTAYLEYEREDVAWALLGAALLTGILWQPGLRLPGTALEGPAGPTTRGRRWLGALLIAIGAAAWGSASYGLYQDWQRGFDRAWTLWISGTAVLGLGLDLVWARWDVPWTQARRRWLWIMLALMVLGAVFRLGTFYFFPAPYYVTQVEELQVGAMALDALNGSRIRWEFLSQAWLGALGITLGGPTLLATRLPSTFLSFLKLVPFFLWLRFSVGNAGAVVGTVLLAVSGWDTSFARVQTNHNVFVVAAAFALLAGPARRGRPSAYAWLGLLSGYVIFEYVLYRPLAVFALGGAMWTSCRDRHARLPARLLRPLIAVALFAAMVFPLYHYFEVTGRGREFFDGYGRARSNEAYYSPNDDWQTAAVKRLERTRQGLALFFFRGSGSPVANPSYVALTDQFTAAMMLFGTAYAIAHPLRQVCGLTLGAALVTLASALVVTGNFDFVRAGSAVGYLFALAGFGAAAVAERLRRLEPRWGKRLAAATFAVGLVYAAWFSLRYLHFLVTAPEIRRAQFRDLAYLSSWVRQSVGDDQRVIVAAPNFPYLMQTHDAAWMRGPRVRGASFWDVQSALRNWSQNPAPTVLLFYAGSTSGDLLNYLNSILPGVDFALEPGPIGPEKNAVYLRAGTAPPIVGEALARWSCEPITISVELLDASGHLLSTVHGTAGMIDPILWPEPIQDAVRRLRPRVVKAVARYNGTFEVKEGGVYVFPHEVYPGFGALEVDGTPVRYPPTAGIMLEPGLHRVSMRAEYDPNAASPSHRLFWQGPDTAGQRQLLPFYRVSPPRPGCG